MNKRLLNKSILLVLILLTIFATTGCFGDPVKSDLKEYLNFEMKTEQEDQEFALDFMENIANSARDKAEFLQLMNDAKQKINESVEKQKSYKPKTKEIQDVHEKKIKILDDSVALINHVMQMVESENPTQDQVNNITKKQQDMIKTAKEYKKDLTTLAKQKEVEVKLNFK